MTIRALGGTLSHDEVGAKAATLGRLAAAGFPVPPGMVVTGSIDRDELSTGLEALGASRLAVRSSAIGEDGVESSMAGRYRSYLDVAQHEVASRIADCRDVAEQLDGSAEIPVIVQAMVEARAAGVAFTADPVTGDRSKLIVSAVAGLGDRLVGGNAAGDEWEVSGRRVVQRRRSEGSVDRRLIRRISALARRVAEHRGAPQDIEWAWDGHRVWVVQTRPITGLLPDVRWDAGRRGVFHRGFRFGEWIPEPVTPLFESWLLTTMEHRLHAVHRRLIGQFAPEPHHVVVNGWYFYSLNFLPVPGASLWRSLPRIIRLAISTPRRVAVMIPQTAAAGYPLYEQDWRADLDPRYREAVANAERELEEAAPDALVEMVDRLAGLAGEYFASIAVVAGSGYKIETRLAQFWNRHLRPALKISHMELLGGLHGVDASDGGPLLATLDWSVEPHAVPETMGPRDLDVEQRRIEAETAARKELAEMPRKLARFEGLLAHVQHLQPVREQQMAGLVRAWPVMRRAVLRLGERLTGQDVIDSPEDAFFLTRDELIAAVDDPAPLGERVSARKQAREAARRLVPPETVGRMPMLTRLAFRLTNTAFGARHVEGALVSGVPASPGIATGTVRVVRDPSAFGAVQPGDVIVAPLTAPAWTPLFGKAVALVTDVGSGLAHASIMAREYGIPAVVGCGDATSRLTDGMVVIVDGSTGSVRRADG